ncbi:hypothetical protein KI387_041444 [Taxus chinensis]|uniref:AP2/ERF domain-containing protein n=1 Tax=Taxus chinensis TaxID=29808 RepID=A0AA38F8K6_TAXCH|nr:hypothetical protein KI387_041444 [Taxus chinensis]
MVNSETYGRHHDKGKWQARIGRINGNKDVYLGSYSTQEEAAFTYDMATIKLRGPDAVINFEKRLYDVERIKNCSLPIGELIKYIKETGIVEADGNVGAARIEQNNIIVSQRSTASHRNDVSESKTANERPPLCFEHQSNPLVAAPKLHSGLWHNPPDDIQTLANVHFHLRQSIMTSSSNTVMQSMMGLGTTFINVANNTGSAAATHTNLSDILEANGMLLSDSSVSFANSSGRFQATPFNSNSNGLEANEDLLPAYIRVRNAAYPNLQRSTGSPTRVASENLAYNNWMAAPLQTLPPTPGLAPIFTPPLCNKWDFTLKE